jgi:filamentous hemagglutinin family protein
MSKLKGLTRGCSLIIQRMAILLFTVMSVQASYANPVVDNVSAGDVSIQQTPGNTQVNQTSQSAVIEWQSFNIDAGEKTHFEQPAGGIALNRISPHQGASQIYGQLTATGKIILVNQAGIYFGPGAQVDVGGIIASTSNISNANFLAGKYVFDEPGAGSVVNRGQIIAREHGLVALMGSNVTNEGMIQARLGNVVLASGSKYTVDLYGDQLINFSVDGASNGGGKDPEGNTMRDAVTNSGSIVADGGTILMTAKTARGVVDNVINMKGVAQATSVSQKNGVIILAGGDGVVKVSGKINASGKYAGQKGGKVHITGKQILVDRGAKIDASGYAGGGEIFIGGNYQGKGPLMNAEATVIMPDTEINADAIYNGKGGTVIAWADDVTKFNGKISARGGEFGGDGGFVETSGKNILSIVTGDVDVSAPNGKAGEWLLDPFNLTISSASSSNIDGSFTATGDDAVVNVSSLTTALASGNVTVSTGSSGSQSGNITVSDAITWSSSNVLTLSAANKIFINAAITAASGGLTLSAADIANNTAFNSANATITSGTSGSPSSTGVTANISVANFILSQGAWFQNLDNVNGTLPTFSASNNFQLVSGASSTDPSSAFLRVKDGDGTSGDHYKVADVYGLQGITGVAVTSGAAIYYDQTQNISASGTSTWNGGLGWVPLGTMLNSALTSEVEYLNAASPRFVVQYDGGGYTINDMTIAATAAIYGNSVGMFAFLTGNTSVPGKITNTGLVNLTLTYNNNAGAVRGNVAGLVGYAGPSTANASYYATEIANSFVTGTLTTASASSTPSLGAIVFIGGMVGNQQGYIHDSYTNVNITSTNGAGGSAVGGIAGLHANVTTASANSGTIQNSYAIGSISANGASVAGNSDGGIGGIIGQYAGTSSTNITTSYATGALTGSNRGGLAGVNTVGGDIISSYWDSSTTGVATSAGDVVSGSSALSTANSLVSTNYSGFTIGQLFGSDTTSPWYQLDNSTRPILAMEYSTTPQTAHALQMIGKNTSVGLAGTYTLGQSINMSATAASATSDVWAGNTFVPIGTAAAPFTGTFSGASGSGYAISNLTINKALTDVGFFGVVSGSSAAVNNLSLTSVSISTSQANSHEGAIIGKLASGTLSNSSASGTVTNTDSTANSVDYVGGLVGYLLTNPATITGSNSSVTVTSSGGTITSGFGRSVGGIVGYAEGGSVSSRVTVTNSYNTGSVTSSSAGNNANNHGVGGLAGKTLFAALSSSYNTGAISGATTEIGGLVGTFGSSTITTSYNLGSVTGTGTGCCVMVGGIVGRAGAAGATADLQITKTFNAGYISTTDSSNRIGGIVGSFENASTSVDGSKITDNYNSGNISVTAGGSNIGGIVGDLDGGSMYFFNNFNVGYISPGATTVVGGVIGGIITGASLSTNNGTTSINNFYNTDTSGVAVGVSTGSSSSVVGKTTSELMTGSTFSGYTFNSSNWDIVANTSFPYLTSIFTSTPRAFSGTLGGTNADKVVQLAVNGTNTSTAGLTQGTTRTGSNGFYYFLEGNGIIADSAPFVVYTTSGNAANAIALAPTSGGSLASLTAAANTVAVSGASGATISNANIASAIGALSSNILLSASGNNLTLNSGISFAASSTPTFNLNGNITASGAGTLSFGGAVSLGAGSVLTTANQTVGFTSTISTINGAQSLQIASGSGAVSFGGAIGLTTAPTTLSSTGSGAVTFSGAVGDSSHRLTSVALTGASTLSGGSVYTSGAQTYTGAVTLGAANTLDSGAALNFNNTLNGAFDLTTNSTGITTFASAVGGGTALNSLNATGSSIAVNGGAVTTTNSQTYNSGVTLGADTTMTTTSGNVSVGNGITGASRNLNLTGGAGSNSFTVGGTLTLNDIVVNGGAGTNTLIAQSSGATQTWTVNAANAGSVAGAGQSGTFTYSNIQNLTGGSNADTFTLTLSGATVAGAINGGSGTNTINADNVANSWSVTGSNAGTVTGVSGGFSNIQNLVGNNNDDTFTLNGGSVSGSINGGSGTNSLTGNNSTNTWTITGSNAGGLTDVSGGFSNIQNLTGGTGADTFRFSDGASVSGTINGGSGGTKTLDYSTSYTNPITLTLTADHEGTIKDNSNTLITTFLNIGNVTAGSGSALVLPSKSNNTLTFTAFGTGQANDPTDYSGFITYTGNGNTTANFNVVVDSYAPATGVVVIGGQPMTFSGVNTFNFNRGVGNVALTTTQSTDAVNTVASATATSSTTNTNATPQSTSSDSTSTTSSSSSTSSSDSSSSSTSTAATLPAAQPIAVNIADVDAQQAQIDSQMNTIDVNTNCS